MALWVDLPLHRALGSVYLVALLAHIARRAIPFIFQLWFIPRSQLYYCCTHSRPQTEQWQTLQFKIIDSFFILHLFRATSWLKGMDVTGCDNKKWKYMDCRLQFATYDWMCWLKPAPSQGGTLAIGEWLVKLRVRTLLDFLITPQVETAEHIRQDVLLMWRRPFKLFCKYQLVEFCFDRMIKFM